MSPDPLGGKLTNPQSLNRYTYVLNNPLSFTDPTGMYVTNCASGDKACQKNADAFEKARQHDLKSKNADIRNAAGASPVSSRMAFHAGDILALGMPVLIQTSG
jgi:uncharacterized protein RhaS with RHS repeats